MRAAAAIPGRFMRTSACDGAAATARADDDGDGLAAVLDDLLLLLLLLLLRPDEPGKAVDEEDEEEEDEPLAWRDAADDEAVSTNSGANDATGVLRPLAPP